MEEEKQEVENVEKVKVEEKASPEDEQKFPVGDFVNFKTATVAEIVDWFLDGHTDVDPTDVIRKWIFAPLPCKLCNKTPEQLVKGDAAKYVITFGYCGVNPGRSIRFFCAEHAQAIQDELVSRGIEITTKEQEDLLKQKLNLEIAVEEDVLTGEDEK